MNFHQKLAVYYILGYFGILFILDINSALREFFVESDFRKDCFVKNS